MESRKKTMNNSVVYPDNPGSKCVRSLFFPSSFMYSHEATCSDWERCIAARWKGQQQFSGSATTRWKTKWGKIYYFAWLEIVFCPRIDFISWCFSESSVEMCRMGLARHGQGEGNTSQKISVRTHKFLPVFSISIKCRKLSSFSFLLNFSPNIHFKVIVNFEGKYFLLLMYRRNAKKVFFALAHKSSQRFAKGQSILQCQFFAFSSFAAYFSSISAARISPFVIGWWYNEA